MNDDIDGEIPPSLRNASMRIYTLMFPALTLDPGTEGELVAEAPPGFCIEVGLAGGRPPLVVFVLDALVAPDQGASHDTLHGYPTLREPNLAVFHVVNRRRIPRTFLGFVIGYVPIPLTETEKP